MKTLFKIAMALIVTLTSYNMASAQINFGDPRYAQYGSTAEEREANMKSYSFMKDSYKMNNYEDYMTRYNNLVKVCPTAHENMYIMGVMMNKAKLSNETDPDKQAEYTKIILDMYDLQAQYFGMKNGQNVKPQILNNKINMLLSGRFSDSQELIIETAHKIIAESGDKLDNNFAILYFGSIAADYLDDFTMLTPEIVLAEFELVSDAVSKSSDGLKDDTLKRLDGFLLNSGAANCDNLETMFREKLKADPNNIELVKKISRYLHSANCEGAFTTEIAEKYYSLDPSADAAYSLANVFIAKKDHEKATKYLKEAIARDNNGKQISLYNTRLAVMCLTRGQNEQAATYAQKAVKADPRNFEGYFLLSQAYALAIANNQISATDDFQKKAAFWLVYDILLKAKSTAPSGHTALNDIQKQLTTVKANFPSMEDIFFRELKVGSPYTVKLGWIVGETKIYDPSAR